MKRFHLLIKGKVQGVSFRFFVCDNAKELGLKGWVRNTGAGDVEMVIEGEEDRCNNMIKVCREGPPLATIEHVKISENTYKNEFSDFSVTYGK